MANYHSQQKKVLLIAFLLSFLIHGIIVALLSDLFRDNKVNQAKNRRPINVDLIQIEPKKAAPQVKHKPTTAVKNQLPAPKPKTKTKTKTNPIVKKKSPKPSLQVKTDVAKQTDRKSVV